MTRRGVHALYGVELMIVRKIPQTRHFGSPELEYEVQYYGSDVPLFGQVLSSELISEKYLGNPGFYKTVQNSGSKVSEWYVQGAWGHTVAIYFSRKGILKASHSWHTCVKEEAEEWAVRLNTRYESL